MVSFHFVNIMLVAINLLSKTNTNIANEPVYVCKTWYSDHGPILSYWPRHVTATQSRDGPRRHFAQGWGQVILTFPPSAQELPPSSFIRCDATCRFTPYITSPSSLLLLKWLRRRCLVELGISVGSLCIYITAQWVVNYVWYRSSVGCWCWRKIYKLVVQANASVDWFEQLHR